MCDGKPMTRSPGDLASSREIHHAMCPTCLESKRRISELADENRQLIASAVTQADRIAELEGLLREARPDVDAEHRRLAYSQAGIPLLQIHMAGAREKAGLLERIDAALSHD